MKPLDVQELKREVNNFHVAKICREVVPILLPFYDYTAFLWADTKVGPKRLDQIFFGLLDNGINQRQDIAQRLGVDEDSFVFQHLASMLREGYVTDTDNRYAVSECGGQFRTGKYFEDSLERVKFKFGWNCVGECVDAATDFRRDGKNSLPHIRLSDEKLCDVVAVTYNRRQVGSDRAFHKVDLTRNQRWYRYKKVYREYVACGYTPKKSAVGEWHVDIRERVADGEKVKTEIREDLTMKFKESEHWRKQIGAVLNI